MINEQSGYEENGQRSEEEVALNQSEIHGNEEKCKTQAFTRVTIPRMTGKKIFHISDQNLK